MEQTELVEPTLELVKELAGSLCLNDLKECLTRGFKTPLEALQSVFDSGELLAIGCVNGKPLMAIGVMKCHVLNPMINEGFLWLVACEEMRQYPKAVLSYSLKIVSYLLKYFDVLLSQVSDERSLKYDKWLGFRETGKFVEQNGKKYQFLINYGI